MWSTKVNQHEDQWELSSGENLPICSLEKMGYQSDPLIDHPRIVESIVDSLHNNLKCLEKEGATGIPSNRHQTGRPRETTTVDLRNLVKAVKKPPKTSVSDITDRLRRAGVRVSQLTVQRRLGEQQYRSYTTSKPLVSSMNQKARIQFTNKNSDESQTFWNLSFMNGKRATRTSPKLMERPL